MKNGERPKRPRKAKDELRAEYRFDYAKARPNRFASRIKDGAVAVILDPDIAAVFKSSDAVNTFLRSIISTLPSRTPKRAKTG